MLKFGNSELPYGLIQAPLAGISDSSFRRVCKSFGAELVFSAMVSSEGIWRQMKKSLAYLNFVDEERPIGIQIFGSNPESMRKAASVIERDFHPDVIDINAGCPVRKVVKTGAGAALLKDLRLLERIIDGVVSSVNIPVSVKIRIGWDKDESVEISKILEGSGIQFLTVHARRAKDDYIKKADWSIFERIKSNVSIPLVANGDITSPQDAAYLLNEVGVDGVMIGRGAIGNPWIFDMMKEFIEEGKLKNKPTLCERIYVLLKQIEMMKRTIGEDKTVKRVKKQIVYWLKEFPGVKTKRSEILASKSLSDMISLIQELC